MLPIKVIQSKRKEEALLRELFVWLLNILNVYSAQFFFRKILCVKATWLAICY